MFLFAFVLSQGKAGPSTGSGFYQRVAHSSEMDPQLALIGPSRFQINTGMDLQAVSLGKDGEPCDLLVPPVLILEGPQMPDASDASTTVSIALERVEQGLYRPVAAPSVSKPGYYRLTVVDPAGLALPFGLPVHAGVEAPLLLLHWGDLHGHSTLSDGTRSPEEYYRWARDVARLDMIALTDHNWALDDAKIGILKELCRQWYQPGHFVPFFGFEWALGKGRTPPARGRPNHKCILFRGVDDDFSPWIPHWHDTPAMADLWRLLEGREAIAIPHHTGLPFDTFYGTDWSQHNEKFERLAEVFSDWGSSETPHDRYPLPEKELGNFIRDVLAQGHRLGLVGGSDTHLSRPGLNAVPRAGHPYALTALTAVEAPWRTRDDLWKALYDRRCYATSAGRRHLLDFTLDDKVMGSCVKEQTPSRPRCLRITVAGASDIHEIVIVKNSNTTAAFAGNGWCQSVQWTDPFPSDAREDYYYVRVEFRDTSMAWSSPIWVSAGKDRAK